ncbi:PIN domain-containing protein [Actinokineospora sp. 24-640]
MLSAVLDTCVLWPGIQRDFLLTLAEAGVFDPRWSSAILDELAAAEEDKLVGRGMSRTAAVQRAEALVAEMRRAFDAEVVGCDELDGTFGLPDPMDEHVLAAAVLGSADVIVTHNLKHFPAGLMPAGVTVLPPSQFTAMLAREHPHLAFEAVCTIACRSGRFGPFLEPQDILDILEKRYGMTETVEILHEALLSPPPPRT